MKLLGRKRSLTLHTVLNGRLPQDGSGCRCYRYDGTAIGRFLAGAAKLHFLLAGILIHGIDIAVARAGSLLPDQSVYFAPSNSRLQNNGSPHSFISSGTMMRFEVRPGDQPSFDSSSVERSEISSGKEIEFGKTYTLSYKFMLEPGVPLTSRWMLLGQVHHRNDVGERGGSPPFGIEVNGEIMRVIARSSTEAIRTSNASARTLWKDETPLQRGRWYDMRFELRFDPFGDGHVSMWIDGTQRLQYKGPLGYNDRRGGYLKIGIYRSASPEPVAVQYDRVEMTEEAPTSATRSEAVNGEMLSGSPSSMGVR